MAIDFPNTPATNDTHTVGTTTWKYDGTSWNLVAAPTSGATGGGTDGIFFENDQTVTTNYTITTNKNAVSAGPVTINSGVTVTIPSGSYWSIV